MLEIGLASLAALVAGFVDAIAGGGGVITFPTLLMLGLPVSTIVGTSKLVGSAGTTVAAYTFARKKKTTSEVLKLALPFTAGGALLGAVSVLALPNEFLKPVATAGILALALYLFIRPTVGQSAAYKGLGEGRAAKLCLGAAALGFYDGFFGPGTGMFLSFMLIRLLGMDFVLASGNTRVLNLASNLIPLAYFLYCGNYRFDLALPMMCANIVGGYLGAHVAVKKGAGFVRWIYLAMAVALALRMCFF